MGTPWGPQRTRNRRGSLFPIPQDLRGWRCLQHGLSLSFLLISPGWSLGAELRVLGPQFQLFSSFPPPSSRLSSFWLPQLLLKVKEQTDKPFPWSQPRKGRLQLESNSESGPGLSLSCECEDRKEIFCSHKISFKKSVL